MPPTASAPTRKRPPKPYDTSDRPKAHSSTSTSLPPGEANPRAAGMTSSKPRPPSSSQPLPSLKSSDIAKAKLQRIRSNESSSSKREAGDDGPDGYTKKNRKKKRKNGIVAAQEGVAGVDREKLVESGAINVDDRARATDRPATPKANGNVPIGHAPHAHVPSSPGSKPMMHTAMDQQMKALNRKTAEIERLQEQLAAARAEREAAGKKEKELALKVGELERECAEHREATDGKDKKLEEHRVAREALLESVQCGVCMDILDDPHTLSCGHIACKKWTPGAYQTHLPNPIPADKDLSYWRKSCHVCRAVVINRPTRLFFLRDILGPLGIDPHIPTSSQQGGTDPWEKTFPPESYDYRIYDDEDRIQRCPSCGWEIDGSNCSHCHADFSDSEEEDFDLPDSENGSIDGEDGGDAGDDDDEDSEVGADGIRPRGIPRWARVQGRPGRFLVDAMRQADELLIDDEASEGSMSGSGSGEGSFLSDGEERDDVDSELGSQQSDQQVLFHDRRDGHRRARDPTPPRHRHHRDREEELVEEEYDEEDEDGYEDSFINDDDDDSDNARIRYRVSDEDDSEDFDGSSMTDSGDTEEGSESEDSSVMEMDEEELHVERQRLQARHPAAPAQAPTRRVVSNEQAAVRRPAGRRARPIVIDSDDE